MLSNEVRLPHNMHHVLVLCVLFIIGTTMTGCDPKKVVNETLSGGIP